MDHGDIGRVYSKTADASGIAKARKTHHLPRNLQKQRGTGSLDHVWDCWGSWGTSGEDRQSVAMGRQIYAPVLTASVWSWSRKGQPQMLKYQKFSLTFVSIGSPG